MGADQQFCLRWNNFHSNITSAFESLRDDEDFVDITLACEGKQIKAHKMVLSACSPYFRSLLKGNPCQHPIVFLKDVTFSNLSSILDFMYHGEVNVSHNELATFLKTAEALKVRGLAEDEKKKDSENYNESSSPPPPRDPPDPGSPRPEEGSSAPDTHLSDSPPPKRQRRRSGNSVHSTEDTNETVLSDQPLRDTSVKNEPQDFNEEEDMLSQSVDQDIVKSDIGDDERNFGPTESVTISRSQAAMQQLQESFGSFLPGMGQSPGFLPHGATDMPRPPPYPLEGVQGIPWRDAYGRAEDDKGLPPGISALPGPSMSQGAASQDASQDVNVVAALNPSMAGVGDNTSGGGCRRYVHTGYASQEEGAKDTYVSRTNVSGVVGSGGGGQGHACTYCGREFRSRSNLSRHVRDHHTSHDPSAALCPVCGKNCRNRSNVLTHMYRVHHITARQLDAFTQPPFTLPQPPITTATTTSGGSSSSSSRPESHTDPPQHLEHLSSQSTAPPPHPLPANQSRDLAVSVHAHDPQTYGPNAQQQQQPQPQPQQQQQQQQQHMSYGYSMQDSNSHHQHHHHHHLQDNT